MPSNLNLLTHIHTQRDNTKAKQPASWACTGIPEEEVCSLKTSGDCIELIKKICVHGDDRSIAGHVKVTAGKQQGVRIIVINISGNMSRRQNRKGNYHKEKRPLALLLTLKESAAGAKAGRCEHAGIRAHRRKSASKGRGFRGESSQAEGKTESIAGQVGGQAGVTCPEPGQQRVDQLGQSERTLWKTHPAAGSRAR